MKMHLRMKFAVVLAVSLAATASLYGQNRASITGTVRDVTGAVLPSATVAVTDVATGVTFKGHHERTGAIIWWPAAEHLTYNLKVTVTGFKTFEASGIILPVGEKARVDATLEVGQITSEISVAAHQRGASGHAILGNVAEW